MTPLRGSTARRYGRVFDEIADEYDRNRPAYPDELVDQACRVAGIGTGDHVLEVGCGTGQLTRSLVGRGLRVTAVEPGKSLIALARHNLEGAGEVEFVNARFEDASLPCEQFLAVFSASAFHWIDPKVSWQRAADVLVPGGTLALMTYCGLEEPRSKPDQEALLAALRKVAPDIAADWPAYRDLGATLAGMEQRRGNISEVWSWLGSYDLAQDYAARLFGDAQAALMPKLVEHTPDELTAIVRTMSYYSRLSAGQRDALEREYEAIYDRLGRPIRSHLAVAVVTARCRVRRMRGRLDLAVVPGRGPVGSLRAVAGMVEHGNIQHIRRGGYACRESAEEGPGKGLAPGLCSCGRPPADRRRIPDRDSHVRKVPRLHPRRGAAHLRRRAPPHRGASRSAGVAGKLPPP
jgi:ubiquinone/menaquinone biosynthesis C-methylase UbiE